MKFKKKKRELLARPTQVFAHSVYKEPGSQTCPPPHSQWGKELGLKLSQPDPSQFFVCWCNVFLIQRGRPTWCFNFFFWDIFRNSSSVSGGISSRTQNNTTRSSCSIFSGQSVTDSEDSFPEGCAVRHPELWLQSSVFQGSSVAAHTLIQGISIHTLNI